MDDLRYRIKDAEVSNRLNSVIRKVFKYTLESDRKRLRAFQGYPSMWTKRLDRWGRIAGLKFIDHEKRDYTLHPILNQHSYLFGGKSSYIFRKLEGLNRLLYGGFSDSTRMQAQLSFFESFIEYSKDFSVITMLDNIMEKELPYYLIKLLNEFKVQADKGGVNLKTFIKSNPIYFREVLVYFSFEEKSDLDCLGDAIAELKSLISARKRDALLKANFVNGITDMVMLIVAFGVSVIPEITSGFDASISDFSKPVQLMAGMSDFLVNKWYIAVLVTAILYGSTRTHLFKLFTGYLAFKLPVSKDYVVNDQILRFLKSYVNIMSSDSPRGSFEQSMKLVSNDYLQFVLSGFVDGSSNDIGNSGKSLHQIFATIPYIPKEYTDIIKEAELLGDTEAGIHKAIDLIEPRVEKLSKQLNKTLFWAIIVVTTLVTILMIAIIFKDMMAIIEKSDQEFIDRLRN
ncbi:MAG: hypothetical protein GX317_02830 [Staphylococcus equorum]|nr:hypothetical protein [Staphylococcus equorum]